MTKYIQPHHALLSSLGLQGKSTILNATETRQILAQYCQPRVSVSSVSLLPCASLEEDSMRGRREVFRWEAQFTVFLEDDVYCASSLQYTTSAAV